MPDYSALEALADIGGANAVPDNTPEMRKTPEPAVGSRSEVTDQNTQKENRS